MRDEWTASPLSPAWEQPAGVPGSRDHCPPLPPGVSRVSWLQLELRRGLERGRDR